jgi:hypothetical protein
VNSGAAPVRSAQQGAQVNIARDRASQYIAQGGDVHVHHGAAANYRMAEYRAHRSGLPALVRRSPSWLLAARYQVVEFTGRERELAELAGWRDDPGWVYCVVRNRGRRVR